MCTLWQRPQRCASQACEPSALGVLQPVVASHTSFAGVGQPAGPCHDAVGPPTCPVVLSPVLLQAQPKPAPQKLHGFTLVEEQYVAEYDSQVGCRLARGAAWKATSTRQLLEWMRV